MSSIYEKLLETDKLIAGNPDWEDKNPKTGDLKLVASFRVGRRAIQGLELIGRSSTRFRNSYTSFTLTYFPTNNRRESIRLCRIDWRPLTVHENDHANTPPDLIGSVAGSHHHSLALNASATGLPLKSLPIAAPILPDYATYKELVDGVGALFRISNAGSAIPSPWPEDLFQHAGF